MLFRAEDGSYQSIDDRTDIFDGEALYEPGYTQVVYLRVNNNGTVPFNYQTAVIINDFTAGQNALEQPIYLQNYLKFGLATADTPEGLNAKVATRELAAAVATEPLNNYHSAVSSLGAGETMYMALVVRMPEEVGNDANYRGLPVPEVQLGISVNATQQ